MNIDLSAPDAAVDSLVALADGAPTRGARLEACRLLGDLAGRSFGVKWKPAERAAWALLDLARRGDSPAERRGLLEAMGRAFRNVWLVPFVHARLDDEDASVVAAAISAAGGLGFAGLEDAVARFLAADAAHDLRLAAVGALGRMGALSSVPRLVPLVRAEPDLASAALRALTEIRSAAAADDVVLLLQTRLSKEVLAMATRYLAEIGREDVRPTLRRLARSADAVLRAAAALATRSLEAEKSEDSAARILAALAEPDRALRAVLARRLRTRPVAEVLGQADTLLGDDTAGVLQVLGEVRSPEVSRFLLSIAAKTDLPVRVRARAVGSIEANEPWEMDALTRFATEPGDAEVRIAAAQTMGAFATVDEVLTRLGPLGADADKGVRGALLWALQLSARPTELGHHDRSRSEKEVRRALADLDPWVRRRAAYVAGNLGLSALAPDLVRLARAEEAKPELRIAAFVGLSELKNAAALGDLVGLAARESDPAALASASRAIAVTIAAHPDAKADFKAVAEKAKKLLGAPDPTSRESALRLAGLAGGLVPARAILPLVGDPAPRVREEAVTALGHLGAVEAEEVLCAALVDVDPALAERAAEALLGLGGPRVFEKLALWTAGDHSAEARARVAARLKLPDGEMRGAASAIDAALARLKETDPAYEPLLAKKAQALERAAPGAPSAADVDQTIASLFPAWKRLVAVRGFAPLARSVRTAEALCRTTAAMPDADFSPPIVLWMKVLEGYLHAALAPRLQKLQSDPTRLYGQVDRLLGGVWPSYEKWLGARWTDPVEVGGARVDVALRSVPNALRDLGDRRRRPLDSPLSVTEWGRLVLLLGAEHGSGVKNLLGLASAPPELVAKTGHRMLVLAAVRNLVTHRAAAGATTLEAFRRSFYATFEEITRLTA
jgi:HEAT repeat protein